MGLGRNHNSRPLDLQSDTLPTALHGPVYISCDCDSKTELSHAVLIDSSFGLIQEPWDGPLYLSRGHRL